MYHSYVYLLSFCPTWDIDRISQGLPRICSRIFDLLKPTSLEAKTVYLVIMFTIMKYKSVSLVVNNNYSVYIIILHNLILALVSHAIHLSYSE